MVTKTFADVLVSIAYCLLLGGVVSFCILCIPYFIGKKTSSFYNSSEKAKKIVIGAIIAIAVAVVIIVTVYFNRAFTDSRIAGIDRVLVTAGEEYLNNADALETKNNAIAKATAVSLADVSSKELNEQALARIGTMRKTQQKDYLRLHMWGLVDSQNETLYAALMDELAIMPAMAYEIEGQIKLIPEPNANKAKEVEAYNAKVETLTTLKQNLEKQFITLKREYREAVDLVEINDLYKKVVAANDEILGQTTKISISIKTPLPEDTPDPATAVTP